MVTEIGIPILTKEIAQRVAYDESLTMGRTILNGQREARPLARSKSLRRGS